MNIKELSQTSDAIYSRKRRLRLKQQELRSDPRKLAAEIAKQIRIEQTFNKTDIDMSWNQGDWGGVEVSPSTVALRKTKTRQFVEVKCPTKGCIAGWATTLVGYPMMIDLDEYGEDSFEDFMADYSGGTVTTEFCHTGNGVYTIDTSAKRLLGLTESQSGYLFYGNRSLDEVLDALDSIAATGTFEVDPTWSVWE